MNQLTKEFITQDVIDAAAAKGITIKMQYSEVEQNPRRAWRRASKLVTGNTGRLSGLSDLTMPNKMYAHSLSKTINNFAKAWGINRDDMVVLGICAIDHGEISIAVTPHRCVFDKEYSGFIYENKQDLYVEFGVKRITKKIQQTVERRLRAELTELVQWANGEVGELVIEKDGKAVDWRGGLYAATVDYITLIALDMINDYSEECEAA